MGVGMGVSGASQAKGQGWATCEVLRAAAGEPFVRPRGREPSAASIVEPRLLPCWRQGEPRGLRGLRPGDALRSRAGGSWSGARPTCAPRPASLPDPTVRVPDDVGCCLRGSGRPLQPRHARGWPACTPLPAGSPNPATHPRAGRVAAPGARTGPLGERAAAERARARRQATPGETIAAGELGEAISRTAGALHGTDRPGQPCLDSSRPGHGPAARSAASRRAGRPWDQGRRPLGPPSPSPGSVRSSARPGDRECHWQAGVVRMVATSSCRTPLGFVSGERKTERTRRRSVGLGSEPRT